MDELYTYFFINVVKTKQFKTLESTNEMCWLSICEEICFHTLVLLLFYCCRKETIKKDCYRRDASLARRKIPPACEWANLTVIEKRYDSYKCTRKSSTLMHQLNPCMVNLWHYESLVCDISHDISFARMRAKT